MELREYWRIFARRWWLAFLPALVIVAYTLFTYQKPPTLFQAHMNFAAGLPLEEESEGYAYDGYYSWLTSEYIANGLSDVVRRERFAAAVSARLILISMHYPQPIVLSISADSFLLAMKV